MSKLAFGTVEGHKSLRPYQKAALAGIRGVHDRGGKALLILPTGTGKTIVFAELIGEYIARGQASLVVAHRDELIEQAREKISAQTGYWPGREKAGDWSDTGESVVVGSVQTLQGKRLGRWAQEWADLVVVDEAHHVPARSYQTMLDHFEGYNFLGVTATPDRKDEKELGEHFDEVAFQYSLVDAIKDGYLAPIVGRKVEGFDIDLRGMKTAMGDFREGDLEEVIAKYIVPIADGIVQETRGLKSLVFLPTVAASDMVAAALRARGINAAYLSGKHTQDERRDVLRRFKIGAITHLCNCSLFLEGFDEPTIEAIVMARPTMSRTLYAQAVGRGTRLSPGKDQLTLVEFTYNYAEHKLVTAYELFASKGYEEAVRDFAEQQERPGESINYLEHMEMSHEEYYSFERMIGAVRVEEFGVTRFDPFELCSLAGGDLTGELDIRWEGHRLHGGITEKQSAVLRRAKIAGVDQLSKAQASALISLIAENGWRAEGVIQKARTAGGKW